MKNTTLYLPGFHFATLRRRPRSALQILSASRAALQQKTFRQLGQCFGKFLPQAALRPAAAGALSRQRVFSKANTFWAFFSQVLDADGGCQEMVRKLQAYAAMKSTPMPSSSTAAYCQARKKLAQASLEAILQHTAHQLQTTPHADRLQGRRVIVVDGTGVSMPETEENQQVWPQQRHQKAGCGFPQASICACFNLHTGGVLSYDVGNKKSHELPMLRNQRDTFQPGDIFLGDKGFCSYYDVSRLKDRGVDSVITLARRRPVTEAESVKILGTDDQLIHWPKPSRNKASSYSQADLDGLPETLCPPADQSQGGATTRVPSQYVSPHHHLARCDRISSQRTRGPGLSALAGGTIFSGYQNHHGHGYSALQNPGHGSQGNSDALDCLQLYPMSHTRGRRRARAERASHQFQGQRPGTPAVGAAPEPGQDQSSRARPINPTSV